MFKYVSMYINEQVKTCSYLWRFETYKLKRKYIKKNIWEETPRFSFKILNVNVNLETNYFILY